MSFNKFYFYIISLNIYQKQSKALEKLTKIIINQNLLTFQLNFKLVKIYFLNKLKG